MVANLVFHRIFKLVMNTWLADRKLKREVIRLDSMRDGLSDDWALLFGHALVALVHTDISLVEVKVRHLVLVVVIAHFEVLGAVHHH